MIPFFRASRSSGQGGKAMTTIVVGAVSYVVESEAAAVLLLQAKSAYERGDTEESLRLRKEAAKAENYGK